MYEVVSPEYFEAELAKRYLLDYIKFMWQRPDPFIVGNHTEEICHTYDTAIKDYDNGKSTFIALKAPFRHGKSDISCRYSPSHFIGRYPDQEVIITAYAYPLVRTFSRFCRDRVMLDPKYQIVFSLAHIQSSSF